MNETNENNKFDRPVCIVRDADGKSWLLHPSVTPAFLKIVDLVKGTTLEGIGISEFLNMCKADGAMKELPDDIAEELKSVGNGGREMDFTGTGLKVKAKDPDKCQTCEDIECPVHPSKLASDVDDGFDNVLGKHAGMPKFNLDGINDDTPAGPTRRDN